MEYRCYIEYIDLKGEGKLTLTEDELCCLTTLDQYAIPFTSITSISIENYQLIVQSEFGTLKSLRLGTNLTPAYLEICEKYNAKVRKALFLDGAPILQIKGEYRYRDDVGTAYGTALIELYERCLCILPPNDGARRIPLCFVRSIEKQDYHHTLTLDTGETYEFIRLGLQTGPFDKKLTDCMYAIRENSVQAALKTDASLSAMQSAQIAKLMPEGVAAPMGKLQSISPSFPKALEQKIQESRAAETYLHFKQICEPSEILIGTKSYLAGDEQKDVLWIVSPKTNGKGGMAALEMAVSEDVSAATYIYAFSGNWETFYLRLNHAIEAIDFHREVIFLSEEDLNKQENALYKMAVRRTPSLRFLRKCFSSRVIHASLESWKRDLEKKFN